MTGNFECLVMPFELTNAPALSQALFNDALCDMLNWFVFVYQHGIFIFSWDQDIPIHYVQIVFQCLLEKQLYVKVEKCDIHVPSVSFLSFMVERG